MSEILDNSIDTIITSPPYNRNKTYSDDVGNEYNDQMTEDQYFAFLKQVWSECFRCLKPEGVFFLNIGDAATDQGKSEKVVNLAVDVGFQRIQTVIWLKSFLGRGHYTPSGGDKRLNNLWENIFVLVKDKKKYQLFPKHIGVPYADKSNIGRYGEEDLRDAGNVWFIPYSKTTGMNIKKGHDAPFPIELPLKCIKLTNAKRVLDPFLGTGSTLAATKLMGIQGIGYEKFPRKELIRETIESSNKDILSKLDDQQILLPHLELTINKLVEVINSIQKIHPVTPESFKFTKKELKELEIVSSVINNLKLDLGFLNSYFTVSKEKMNSTVTKIDEFINKTSNSN